VTDPRPPHLPIRAPAIVAPPPIVERRTAYRRAVDRAAQDEAALLAHCLDVLAADLPAEERLARLLALLARTVGARRAAVLATGFERRVAVSLVDGEDASSAQELAAWLDAQAPRPRAERAAAAPAPISFAVHLEDAPSSAATDELPAVAGAPWPYVGEPDGAKDAEDAEDARGSQGAAHYAYLQIPEAGSVSLGFDFASVDDAASVGKRLPPNLARHAAVALALVSGQLATERELAELRARDAERITFVSTVAHELRTPLTGLNGYLELMLAGRVPDPNVAHEFLERSHGIVGTMSELVGDLLELSQLEAGTLGLELTPISVHEVGSRVVDQLTPIAMDRGITLRVDLPPRLRSATGDRRRVEQIVGNLIGNALKFTSAGGAVELAGWFDGPVALVAVRDDGPGIEHDDRGRIFERFYRGEGQDKVTGTGLGLPIARDLARAMGGDLDVASVRGSGSTFMLALPGPIPIDGATLGSILGRALAFEEVRLEERAVLAAIHTAGRFSSPLPPPRALPSPAPIETPDTPESADTGSSAPTRTDPSGPRLVGAPGSAARTYRFGVIEGTVKRPDSPTLA
jgi:signal transduction histidine kinase